MKKGDLVWVIPEKKHGIITQTMPPTVLFPAEFVTVNSLTTPDQRIT